MTWQCNNNSIVIVSLQYGVFIFTWMAKALDVLNQINVSIPISLMACTEEHAVAQLSLSKNLGIGCLLLKSSCKAGIFGYPIPFS